MSPSEVLDFLLPQIGDPLQVGFLAIILLMMAFTIASAHLTARPASWQRKWDRGTPNDHSDDLDIEHGSVTDLWHAVATAPEKLAEIMPGMLLVIGLLGTFLGLGLALNHASHILGQPNALSASGAANSMQDLLGLLQGLGTKFKTSTWGITGFVLLKIWSEVTRFDEKRLTWVIGKVKTELESRKQQQAANEIAKQNALFGQIGSAADSIVKGFADQIASLKESDKALHQQALANIHQGVEGIRADLGQVRDETSAMIAKQNALFGQIGSAADSIVKGFADQIASLKESDKALHQQALANLHQGVKGIRADLGQVRDETSAMNAAMVKFTEGTQGVVENLAEAAGRMAGGADKVGDAAKALVDAVDAFKTQFTDVLDNVRQDLGAAISEMSARASETLKQGSSQLGDATREISSALGVLSADVKATMNDVQSSINKALEIQQRAANEFTLSSRALNDNITATTEIVGKLAVPIQEGLQSVADSGRRMHGIGKTLENSIQSMGNVVERLVELPTALAPLKTIPDEQRKLISTLKPLGTLPAQQQAVLRELQGLRSDLKSSSDRDHNR